eukprot:g5314.t1
MKPGAKYFEWERRGVPLRLELGMRDLEKGIALGKLRTGGEKFEVPLEDPSNKVSRALTDMKSELKSRSEQLKQRLIFRIETAVQNLCEMGFPRELVRQCLRAAFNNADRAVEYLMSGIPPHLQHLACTFNRTWQLKALMPQQPSRPLIPAPETGPLAPLANHPKFNALRQAVQQHPSTLNQVLTVIAKGDPEMIKLIAEHQDEFVRLLSQPPTADPIAAMLQAAQARGAQPARPPQLGAGDEEAQ